MNAETTDVIERIDTLLHVCTWCGHGLGSSPSPDFCSEGCQRAWHTRRCLVGTELVVSGPARQPASREGDQKGEEADAEHGHADHHQWALPVIAGF